MTAKIVGNLPWGFVKKKKSVGSIVLRTKHGFCLGLQM